MPARLHPRPLIPNPGDAARGLADGGGELQAAIDILVRAPSPTPSPAPSSTARESGQRSPTRGESEGAAASEGVTVGQGAVGAGEGEGHTAQFAPASAEELEELATLAEAASPEASPTTHLRRADSSFA